MAYVPVCAKLSLLSPYPWKSQRGGKINLYIVSQNEAEDKNIAQAAKQEGKPLELMIFSITKCSEM